MTNQPTAMNNQPTAMSNQLTATNNQSTAMNNQTVMPATPAAVVTADEWKEFAPRVRKIASGMLKEIPQNSYAVDVNDLMQCGYFTLCRCRENYKAESNAKFSTYFKKALENDFRYFLRKHVQSMMGTSVSLLKKVGDAGERYKKMCAEKGLTPKEFEEEIYVSLFPGEDPAKLRQEFKQAQMNRREARNEKEEAALEKEMGDTVTPTPAEQVVNRETRRALMKLWQALSYAEQVILKTLIKELKTEDACCMLGVTPPTFRTRREKLLARLQGSAAWQQVNAEWVS